MPFSMIETDQLHELLPEYMQEEGQGFQKFLTAYFDFLEKGILIYKEGTDLEQIGLEDGKEVFSRERNFTHLLYLNQNKLRTRYIRKCSNRFVGNW